MTVLESKINDQHKELLKQLTPEEKAMLCSGKNFWHLPGIERLDLPSIIVTDGPHGLRKQRSDADHLSLVDSVPATCFPTASGLAATWDRALLKEIGVALGQECRKEGVSVLLGPGINIKRNPLGGRNFEYFSEDPYLSGQMAVAWIQGVQSQQVGTSLKHYAVNNHEQGRMVVDAIVDARTLREIYLPAFEVAVKEAQPWTIMCAYNKLNGIYLSENRELLTTILRDEWGFEGIVITDWGAANDRVLGLKNGLNLEMPSSGQVNTRRILAALENGDLSQQDLDESVSGVLELILKSVEPFKQKFHFSFDKNHELARRAAEQACVLLKNDDQRLPLQTNQKIAVIGALATQTRYQGSGSSQVNPTRLEQPLEQLTEIVGNHGFVEYALGYPLYGENTSQKIDEALAVSAAADVVVLIVGLTPEYEAEGFDRSHLSLPSSQLQLIEAMRPLYDKLVIVLQNGAPVELPFANEVPAILEAYLGGQAGASALANILFGRANPSGKLAETFSLAKDDVPSQSWFPGELRQSQYRESIWVGYRYFASSNVQVAFPFGHGLSYTKFEYSNLVIKGTQSPQNEGSFVVDSNNTLSVEFTVRNSGDCEGAEVAQVYVGQRQSSVPRPRKELKEFARLFLRVGESKTVRLTLDKRAFAWWDSSQDDWVLERDTFSIVIGASVEDVRLEESVILQSDIEIKPRNSKLAPYFKPELGDFNDDAFVALLDHSIPQVVASKPYQLNSTVGEIQSSLLGRLLKKIVLKSANEMAGSELKINEQLVIENIVNDLPLRNIVNQSQGKLSSGLMRAIIHVMNGHWFKLLSGAPVRNE